jgi:hypothetical protein
VQRTPIEYAAHVLEFLAIYGAYAFEIEGLIAADDRAFVRVNRGRIVEYWIQMDRKGLELQLAAGTRGTPTH